MEAQCSAHSFWSKIEPNQELFCSCQGTPLILLNCQMLTSSDPVGSCSLYPINQCGMYDMLMLWLLTPWFWIPCTFLPTCRCCCCSISNAECRCLLFGYYVTHSILMSIMKRSVAFIAYLICIKVGHTDIHVVTLSVTCTTFRDPWMLARCWRRPLERRGNRLICLINYCVCSKCLFTHFIRRCE